MPGTARVSRRHAGAGARGLEQGSPFSVNILALAIYLRFSHAISYRRLTAAVPRNCLPRHQRRSAGRDVPPRRAMLR